MDTYKKFDDSKLTIFIDIDNTILRDTLPQKVKENALEIIKKLSTKCNIVIWTKGGYSYAKQIVSQYKITPFITAILPKPDICVDDENVTADFIELTLPPDWREIEVLSEALQGTYLEDKHIISIFKKKRLTQIFEEEIEKLRQELISLLKQKIPKEPIKVQGISLPFSGETVEYTLIDKGADEQVSNIRIVVSRGTEQGISLVEKDLNKLPLEQLFMLFKVYSNL